MILNCDYLLRLLLICPLLVNGIDEERIVNLCANNTFKFDSKLFDNQPSLVNSFIRADFEEQFPQFSAYFLSPNLELDSTILTNDELIKIMDLSRKYNNIIFDLLSENTGKELYKNDKINSIELNFKHYKLFILNIINKLRNETNKDHIDHSIEYLKIKFDTANQLIDTLINLKEFTLSNNLLSKNELKDLLISYDNLLTENLIPSFKDESIDLYFNQPIFKLTDYNLNRESKFYFSFESYIKIKYSLYIPLNNRNNIENIHSNCVYNFNLPDFYHLND